LVYQLETQNKVEMKNRMKTQLLAGLVFLMLGFAVSCNRADTKEGQAPKMEIHQAVFMGNLEEVDRHIAYGSDLNVKDDYGSTPLNIAATFGHTEIAQHLIKGGCRPQCNVSGRVYSIARCIILLQQGNR
jgi:ankyrin repeat protein